MRARRRAGQARAAGDRHQAGFTLIELLVVIIILGILAAAVVFAVRGVGDKGKSSASSIDARTIRTAQEAYCARNGSYASAAQLVSEGFLSEAPTLHDTDAVPLGTQGASGNCSGAGDPARASFFVSCNGAEPSCGGGGAVEVAWREQVSGTGNGFSGVSFVDNDHGWVVGQRDILATTDGGVTWVGQRPDEFNFLLAVDFVDRNLGVAVGSLGLMRTTDGGVTWSGPDDLGVGYRGGGVDMLDASQGWIVGNDGAILHTTDGGATWQPQVSPTSARLRDVQFIDASYGWAVGYPVSFDEGECGKTVLRTTDGGATWTVHDLGDCEVGGHITHRVVFVDRLVGWTISSGDPTFKKSTDGGITWAPVTGPGSQWFSESSPLTFVGSRGWASTLEGMAASSDLGGSWAIQDASLVAGDISFVDALHGWAVGGRGRILRYGPPLP